ncbi:MAG: glucose-6-phosphate dehydrogenase [Planctomycetota bacterium]
MAKMQQAAEDCLIVIFGASGDLTLRKLVPAVYYLWKNGQMPSHFGVVGVSRTKYTDDDYREQLYSFSPKSYESREDFDAFAEHVHYVAADSTKAEAWPKLQKDLEGLSAQHGTGKNYLFYLSLSPQFFEPVIRNIGATGMVTDGKRAVSVVKDEDSWQRIVVEKPFGNDPESAVSLNRTLAETFFESSIYRIDHYLAKELVANLLVLRFANTIFEPIWNRNFVDHVQITASEAVGVEDRGSYYDGPSGGAMRDMVQSHLLQVLSLVAMEPPVTLDGEDIRTEKVKVFKALRVPEASEVPKIAVRGQYSAGLVGGEKMIGYRETDGVDPASQTDTYTAMQFSVETMRWGGTPFYLRSGKAMAEKKTEIVVYLKDTPHCLFSEEARQQKHNQIVINVQPDEGIRVRFNGKVPGPGLKLGDVVMDFDYVKQWDVEPPDGYATLLGDVMRGDQSLFKHRDEIEASWFAVQPVLDYWAANPDPHLPNYNAGSWGPSAADVMMERAGRYWRND